MHIINNPPIRETEDTVENNIPITADFKEICDYVSKLQCSAEEEYADYVASLMCPEDD